MTERYHKSLLVIATLLLAFCSIVYELVLGQALSAFLGDTVLRYSVTIGLYLFSMGVGAYWAEEQRTREARSMLVNIELGLSLIGGGVLFLLHAFHALVGIGFAFSLFAHSLIVTVGILTGFELPLLILLWGEKSDSDGISVIALNYLGALLGPILFALYFYPTAGLVWTSLLMGAINSATGTVFILAWRKDAQFSKFSMVLLPLLTAVFIGLMLNEQALTEFFVEVYLKR